MDVFEIDEKLIGDYKSYMSSFVSPRDKRIAEHLEERLASGEQWPDPWLSLNPNFAPGGTVSELVRDGLLHPECERIFRLDTHAVSPGPRILHMCRHTALTRCWRGTTSYQGDHRRSGDRAGEQLVPRAGEVRDG